MSCSAFLKETVMSLEDDLFIELRDILIDNYLTMFLLPKEDLTPPALAEKLCDYFEKIELKTGKTFLKTVEKYTADLDSVIREKIAKEPKPKKGLPAPPIPRARKYYDRASGMKKQTSDSYCELLDYTRIMLCLYNAIQNSENKEIDDFDLSISKLNLTAITEALLKEPAALGKKMKFDTKESYGSDRSTFILLIILYYYMKSKEIKGEYEG